jgi:alpha-methylacyl-CoA racemase
VSDTDRTTGQRTGPLSGLRFVEMAGIGPAPLACMILADLGATGIRIESPRGGLSMGDPALDITRRGRPSAVVDVRSDEGREWLLDVITQADLLIEGFRPGVMERLGVGPTECFARNERLVFGRMTGWGQEGPYARVAGHDLTYLAAAGVLAHVGRREEPPTPPLNLVADNGGGAMLLLVGLLSALWESQRSGRGQVVDAAMVDGAAVLMSLFHSMRNQGMWSMERGVNLLDSGAPFYDVYRTRDGGWLALACLEPQFYAAWLERAGVSQADLPAQYDISGWGRIRAEFERVIAERTRDEWRETLAGSDACAEVVLTMVEAAQHPHLKDRGVLIDIDGQLQPAPAPRFSRTRTQNPGEFSVELPEVLDSWGVGAPPGDA